MRTIAVLAVVTSCAAILGGCEKKPTKPHIPSDQGSTAATINLIVSPQVIQRSQSAQLRWSSERADSVFISTLGFVELSGTRTVSPRLTTEYTAVGYGKGGNDTARVSLQVLPAAPRNLRLNGSVQYNRVPLVWDVPLDSTGLVRYNVKRCTGANCEPRQTIAEVETATNYSDVTISPGATYWYAVAAIDSTGDASPPSNQLQVTVPGRPAAPSLSLSVNPRQIQRGGIAELRWGSVNADSVFISTLGYVELSGTRIVSPILTTTYLATAVGPGGRAEASAILRVKPLPPRNLRVISVRYNRLVLSWEHPADTTGLAGYTVRWCSSAGCTPVFNRATLGLSTSFTDSGTFFRPNTTYNYEIVSRDRAEELSLPSNRIEVVVPPAPRLIIEAPMRGDTVGNTVTFRWRLENPVPGESYRYKLRLDQGVDACDNWIEEEFDAGSTTCITVILSGRRYNYEGTTFAIRAFDSQGEVLCERGWWIWVNPTVPPSPPCGAVVFTRP